MGTELTAGAEDTEFPSHSYLGPWGHSVQPRAELSAIFSWSFSFSVG